MDEITLPISTHIHNSQNPKYKNIYVVKLVSWKCAYFKGEKNAQNIKNTYDDYGIFDVCRYRIDLGLGKG